MAAETRWRKAVAVSVLLHCIVLMTAGWLVARHVTVYDMPEQYLDLDLVNDLYGEDPGANAAGPDMMPAGGSTAAAAAAPPEAARAAAFSERNRPTVVAAASNMSVLTAEAGGGAASEAGASSGAGKGSGAGDGDSGSGTGGGAGAGTGSGSGGTGGAGRGGGIINPGISSRVDPDYPEQARRSGWEGTVVLSIQILPNGRPGDVSVYRSSGYEVLDDAAVDAVRQWRFIPARERSSGQSIACRTTMPVVFKLR